MEFSEVPFPIDQYLQKVAGCKSQDDVHQLTEPFMKYESKLREVFAQEPDHAAVAKEHLVSVFGSENPLVTTRARNLKEQSDEVKERYLLTLTDEQRRAQDAPATVKDFSTFKTNFNLFSESSLTELDWSNVVACGSSVVTALLPVPARHNESKRSLRSYYHTILAPASDVDLFIYGLNEEQAIEKIKQIERSVKDSILSEVTTIRTKVIMITSHCSQHLLMRDRMQSRSCLSIPLVTSKSSFVSTKVSLRFSLVSMLIAQQSLTMARTSGLRLAHCLRSSRN
jgi:hypothetical protein